MCNREPVHGSPFLLTVHAAETSAAISEVDTTYLHALAVGVPSAFTITAYDRHRNRALRGGDPFRAILRCPDGSKRQLQIDDRGDGSYRGSVQCRQTGTHYLETFLDAAPLASSPHTLVAEAGPPRARFSTARANFLARADGAWPADLAPSAADDGLVDVADGGSADLTSPRVRELVAGERAPVALIAMDSNGNPAPSSNADWHVHLKRTHVGDVLESTRPQVTPAPDGSGECVATLDVATAGEYLCHVSLRGEEVGGSPFGLTVVPSPLDVASSGVGEHGVPVATAGQEGKLTLVLRDQYGNQLLGGGERVAVQLRCPLNGLAQRAAVTDVGNGTYSVRFRPQVATPHELHAWLLPHASNANGANAEEPLPLGGMPYAVQVLPGALSCGMSGEASSSSQSANAPAAEEATGGASANVHVARVGTPSGAGAPSGALARHASGGVASPPALSVVAGSRGSVFLQLRDAHGNARPPSGEVFVSSLERPRDRNLRKLPVDEEARRHAAGATLMTASEELRRTRMDDVVSEGAVGRGGGGVGASLTAASTLMNADGAEVSDAHAEALASALRAAGSAPVTLLGEHHHPLPRPAVGASADGRVEVSFVVTRIERLLLHVAVQSRGGGHSGPIEEVPLRGSPFAIDVLPAPAAARKCEAFGDHTRAGAVRAPASFVILARDAHGNRRTTGGERFVVSFRGPCNPIARVHDRGDGTYRVTYVAAVSGACMMSVTLNKQPIQGSPFQLKVYGGRQSTAPSDAGRATPRAIERGLGSPRGLRPYK